MAAQHNDKDTESETEAEPPDERAAPRLDVTGTQVCASTLASVSAAAVASIFGVAGTIVGAAVVSVATTTGGAVYSHGIRRTGVKLQQTQAARPTRLGSVWQRIAPTRETGRSDAAAASGAAAASSPVRRAPGPDRSTPSWKEWLSQRRWGVAAGVAIVFVASLAAVTLIELVGQQSLASISGSEPSGSTSIGSLFGADGQDTPDDTTTSTTTAVPSDPGAPSDAPEPSTEPNSDSTVPSSTTPEEQPTADDPLP